MHQCVLFIPEIDIRALSDVNASLQLESTFGGPSSEPVVVDSANNTAKEVKLSGKRYLERAKLRFRKTCTTKQLFRRLPFIQWSRTYSFNSGFSDFMAGITVALTAIPQGIAYGAVAGVPVEVQYQRKLNKSQINSVINKWIQFIE